MISLKELQYVNSFEQKAPYPGDKYAKETLEEMIKMHEKFKNNYKDKRFSIIFSDTSESEFEIYEFNLCHLLGVNYSNIATNANGMYDDFLKDVLNLNGGRISSYQLLTKILDNYEEVIKHDSSEKYRALNYYKSRIKCAIFEKISEFERFNFGKVESAVKDKIEVNLNDNVDTTLNDAVEMTDKADNPIKEDKSILLYTPSNEAVCPYFFIRIDKGDNADTSVVKSLIAPERDRVSSFFKDRVSAIPTQMIIDDNQNLKKTEATAEEKINMLNMYKLIITEYGLENKIDISGDYLATLAELNSYQKRK